MNFISIHIIFGQEVVSILAFTLLKIQKQLCFYFGKSLLLISKVYGTKNGNCQLFQKRVIGKS